MADSRLELFIATTAKNEAMHELKKQGAVIAERSGVTEAAVATLLALAAEAGETNIYTIAVDQYRALEQEARSRIPGHNVSEEVRNELATRAVRSGRSLISRSAWHLPALDRPGDQAPARNA